MFRTATVITLLAALAPQAQAQVRPGEFGFSVTATSTRAGNFCGGFSCTPSQMAVPQNDTLTMTVRTELGEPFVIAAAPSIGRCMPIPGIAHQLVLDPASADTLALGIVSNPSPILACWSGYEDFVVRLPTLPSPTTFYLQALTAGPSLSGRSAPAFTIAVECTVR